MTSRARSRLSVVLLAGLLTAATLPANEPRSDPGARQVAEIRALLEAGRYAEAETAAREELARAEGEGSPDPSRIADTLDVLVEALWRGGKSRDPGSRDLAERAVHLRESSVGSKAAGLGVSLHNLASLLYSAGEYAQARPVFERAIDVRERSFGKSSLEVAQSVNGLANVLSDLGDAKGAIPLYERSLAIREAALGPDDPAVASSLLNIGNVHMQTGDFAAARPLYDRALRIREKSLGPEHPDVAGVLDNLGAILEATGDLSEAERCLRRALAIQESALGPGHPDVALTLDDLGDVLAERGAFPEAREALERACDIFLKTSGPEGPPLEACLLNLGALMTDIADDDRARDLFTRSLAISEKVFGPDSQEVAHCLLNIGLTFQNEAEFGAAKPYYERALGILDQTGADDPVALGMTASNLADTLFGMGDLGAAIPIFERALAIKEGTYGPDHPLSASTLIGLGAVRAEQGDVAAACSLFERAKKIREKGLGPEHLKMAEPLLALATLDWMSRHDISTLQGSLRAESIVRRAFRRTARSLSTREALGLATVHASALDLALSVVSRSGTGQPAMDAGATTWDALIRSRAMVFDETITRRRALVAAGGYAAIVDARLSDDRSRLAQLVVRGRGMETIGSYAERLRAAQDAVDLDERDLARESERFRRDRATRQIGLSDVRRALPAGAALLAYASYARDSRSWSADHISRGGVPSYMAFVLRSGRAAVRAVSLGPAAEIDAAVARWREEIASPPRDLESLERYRGAGLALRRAIWDPIASVVADRSVLFVVPDGALRFVNLATLPLDDGRYLVETKPWLHQLTTERDIVRVGTSGARGRGLLVLAAPDDQDRLSPLPGALSEAEDVAAIWRRAIPEGRPDRDVVELTGAGANRSAFTQQSPGRRVLHLATHALSLAEDRGSAAAPDHRSTLPGRAGRSGAVSRESPMTLSGLALARTSPSNPAEGQVALDQGVITAEEIASLDMSGVEWVVLSACETGLGPAQAGEGVLGLRRAFEVAGARTVITSLWSVSDADTRAWMDGLYARRLSGFSTVRAVRAASLDVIAERRRAGVTTHPFFWGAFIAAGDWK